MRRDMELIRALLLKLEGMNKSPYSVVSFTPDDEELVVEGYTQDEIVYHLLLIYKSGLVETGTSGTGVALGGEFMFRMLSPQGHDLIDSIRDDEVWRKTKEGASKAGSWTVGLVAEAGKAYAKMKFKEATGLDI